MVLGLILIPSMELVFPVDMIFHLGKRWIGSIAGGIINKIIFLPSSCLYNNHPPSIPTSSTGWRNNRLQVDLDGSGGLRGGAG
jgi:hypothetical protein